MVAKTLTSDSIQTGSNDGLDFDATNETWTIAAGVVVFSQSAEGVYSNGFANNTLINDGRIYAADVVAVGVYLSDGNDSVFNGVGAEIFGTYFAVLMNGAGNDLVNNFGNMIGATAAGVAFGSSATGILLNNHGYIFGHLDGVSSVSFLVGGTINNFHTITADQYGIGISTAPDLMANITNAAGGVIKGLTDAIYIGSGMFHFINHGKVIGGVFDAANERDVVFNHGIIRGPVQLQGGNDLFNGAGGKSGPVFGGDGNDRLIGGSHNDLLHGGDGNDTLTGGPGADKFFFDTALNAATNVDKITDFTPAQHDKIVLSETYFAGIGPLGQLHAAHFHVNHAGPNASPQIVYIQSNGFLYYDANGNLPGGMTHFATLSSHPAIGHADFLVSA